jgi:hypothetical protein
VLVDRTTTHVRSAVQGLSDPATIGAATAHGSLQGFHDAFWAATALYLLGVVFAFLIHDEDAAPSMRARERKRAPAEPPAREVVAAH